MKNVFYILILSLSIPLHAQFTTVNGTFKDPTGQVFSNGSYTITFVPTPNKPGPYTVNGASFSTGPFTGALNSAGSISLSGAVTDNSLISPAGSTWLFVICPNASTQCTSLTTGVSGASVDISASINALIKPLLVLSTLVWPRAYQDTEIGTPVPDGTAYYNTVSGVPRAFFQGVWSNLGGAGGGNVIGNSLTNNCGVFGAGASNIKIDCGIITNNTGGLTAIGLTSNTLTSNASMTFGGITFGTQPAMNDGGVWPLGTFRTGLTDASPNVFHAPLVAELLANSSGSTSNYTKGAVMAWAVNNDITATGNARDVVGVLGYGVIKAGNNINSPHAFGMNSLCEVESGANGQCLGHEIDIVNQNADSSPNIDDPNQTIALWIANTGTFKPTAAIAFAQTAAPFQAGIYIRNVLGPQILMQNNFPVVFRNAANTTYLNSMFMNISNKLEIGNAAPVIIDDGLQVNVGVQQGSGLKHERFPSCTTTAVLNGFCSATHTWATPFTDANYTVTCNSLTAAFGVYFTAITAANFTYAVWNGQGVTAAQTGTMLCIAMHD